MEEKINYNIIIVGCGFAGTVVAEKLSSNLKNNILIIDQRSHIAGNAYDYCENNINIHKYGPHLLHTNNKAVYDYLMQFGEWYSYEHKVLAYIDYKYIPLPFNFNSLDLVYDKKIAEHFKKLLIEKYGLNSKTNIIELQNAEILELKNLSDFVYKKIYYYYSLKQWGMSVDKINPEVLKRMPINISEDNRYFQDKYQILPKNGYIKIFEKMLSKPNINIQLDTRAKDILKIKKNNIFYNDKLFKGLLIYTGSIDELLDYKYGVLPYRSLKFVPKKRAANFVLPTAVVNYPQKKQRFTRIVEYKHLMQNSRNNNSTIIIKELPCKYSLNSKKRNIPYYPIETPQNLALHNKYKEDLEKITNLHIIGRLAEYKYYNMDEIIERAFELYEKIIK